MSLRWPADSDWITASKAVNAEIVLRDMPTSADIAPRVSGWLVAPRRARHFGGSQALLSQEI